MAKYIAFVGPSYTAASKTAAYDELYNWFPERIESGTGPTQYWLMPTPGFLTVASGLDSPGRGGITLDEALVDGAQSPSYFISGSTLYRYPSTVMATGISNLADHPVTIVTNGAEGGHQLLFASDSTVYCFDTTTHVLTSVATGHAVAFLNGYGISLNRSTNSFQFSALFDFTSWDALDVVVREDASDNWQTVFAYREELWFFGAVTTSIYYNADDPDIPWKPNSNAFIQTGILSPYAVCLVGGSPMWLGRDVAGSGIVYRANGYTPQRISTHAVEFSIQTGTQGLGGAAELCTYQQNGHVFGELTLPENSPDEPGGTFGTTWVYDDTEGLWHKRGLRNSLQFEQMDTRGYFDGISLSRSSGTVYAVITSQESSSSWLGTDGNPVTRLRRAPHIFDEHKGVIIDRFELHLETGLGLGGVPSTTVGYDPQIAMRFSNNGGQTWSNTRLASAGRLGEFNTRAEWNGLGYGRDRIIEVSVSAPIPWRLIDAFLDVRVGSS